MVEFAAAAGREFAVLLVVAGHQFKPAPCNPARGIDVVDRQLCAVVPADAQVGNAPAQPAQETDAQRLPRAAIGSQLQSTRRRCRCQTQQVAALRLWHRSVEGVVARSGLARKHVEI